MQMGRLAGWLALALVGVVGCGRPDGEDGAVTEPFGDNRVLGLALALTDHQVIIAEAALSRPLSIPAVQDYAMRLAAEQREAGDRLRALGMEQGLFVDQATAEAETHIEDTKVDIRSMQDAPEYIADSAHDVHKAVRVFDNTLLVKVNNAALRAELEVIRAQLAADLAQALQIERDNGVPPKPD